MKNTLFCLRNPPVNPLNGKAQRVPIINPFDRYGRVFFFSWASFCCSFAAWYSFSPLSRTIRADIKITQVQWLNSNIVALLAGMVMRAIVGPCCDRFGPRKTMTGILIAAAIPCGLAGTIKNYTGLLLIRFFVGIAGASFVPCISWCTIWFDKNAVSTANGLSAGWGNAGAGITYFMMPAVYDSLRKNFGHSSHVAWRISFIVPTILLLLCAAGTFFLCEDTPTGTWASRFEPKSTLTFEPTSSTDGTESPRAESEKGSEKTPRDKVSTLAVETLEAGEPNLAMEAAKKPSLKEGLQAILSLQTMMLALPYACSFGGELAVNSILGPWYLQRFPRTFTQTSSGQAAAAFGLFNIVSRPFGGIMADIIYSRVSSRWGVKAKQLWYGGLVAMQGVFLLWIGLVNPNSVGGLVGGIQAMALFMDAANGAAYGLVPHVNPQQNGLMSGMVGATGNLGGVMWSIAYRYTNYHVGTWIIGVGSLAIGLGMMVIPPISRRQLQAGGYMSQ